LVATRFEQQLFMVDTLRTMMEFPTPRTHLHHLFGDYPCTTNSIDGTERENAAVFKFLNKRIGDRVVPARFAPGQSREDRISAVHYIRFGVGRPEALSRGPVRLEVNHAGYSAAAELSAETLEELRKDLAG
jgi:hypothetical protein